jgi:hypothetical protein
MVTCLHISRPMQGFNVYYQFILGLAGKSRETRDLRCVWLGQLKTTVLLQRVLTSWCPHRASPCWPVENLLPDAIGQPENSWGPHREIHLIGQLKHIFLMRLASWKTAGDHGDLPLMPVENYRLDAVGQLENSWFRYIKLYKGLQVATTESQASHPPDNFMNGEKVCLLVWQPQLYSSPRQLWAVAGWRDEYDSLQLQTLFSLHLNSATQGQFFYLAPPRVCLLRGWSSSWCPGLIN